MARRRSGDTRSTPLPGHDALRSPKHARQAARAPSSGVASKHVNGNRRSSIIAMIGVTVAVIATLAYAGVLQARRTVYAARLPAVPDLSAHPVAFGEHLREKYRAAQREPTSAAVVGPLCLAYHADMFYDQAERCYVVAEELSPEEWRWPYYRALIQSERGSGDAVAGAVRRVVRLKPEFGPAWWRLGEAEFKAGRYDRAEEAWRRVASLPEPERVASEPPARVAEVPISAYASFGLARVALVRGEADRARQILERVTSTAPRFGSAFRLLAESYSVLGQAADADRAMHRASRLPPYAPYADPMVDVLARESRNGTFLLRQASEADLATNAEWSEYLTRRALEVDPDNPDVISKLGRILRTLGRNDEALEFFRRYHELVPGDFQGLAQIGSCLSGLGRFVEAEPFLRRALQGLDDALTHYNLGLLLAQTGRLEEAVAEYERALERDPYDLDARSNLAAVLVRQGKLGRASRELTRVLGIDPENAVAHTNLGLVLAQQGEKDQAARHFQEALRIDPNQTHASEALLTLGR